MSAAKKRWTDSEDAILRELWPFEPLAVIEHALRGRSRQAIRYHAAALGIECDSRPRPDKVISLVIRGDVDGKACTKCLEWKPLPKFARHKTCAGGRRSICTTCEGRAAYKGNRRAKIDAVRRYQKRHPEKAKLHALNAQARWRSRKKSQGTGVSLAQLEALRDLYGGCCACGDDADSFDHVIPLSRGGPHEIGNLVPACRPCNSSKKDSTPEEWAERRRRMEN